MALLIINHKIARVTDLVLLGLLRMKIGLLPAKLRALWEGLEDAAVGDYLYLGWMNRWDLSSMIIDFRYCQLRKLHFLSLSIKAMQSFEKFVYRNAPLHWVIELSRQQIILYLITTANFVIHVYETWEEYLLDCFYTIISLNKVSIWFFS